MVSQPTPAHIPCEIWEVFPFKRNSPERDLLLYSLILHLESLHKCPRVRGVGTGGKDISHFREVFLHHLRRGHIPATIPARCANGVKNLTELIVRMDAYPVAHGGFSDVWKCQLQHEHGQRKPLLVAVKAVRPVTANDEESRVKRKAVQQEFSVWVRLRHRNILPLYGITDGFGSFPAFVCPWAGNGTLSEYLEKFERQLDLKKRMRLLHDIATGLCYLHSQHVVHGDLSGSNVLVSNNGRAQLSDFGLSTLLGQVSDTSVAGISFPGNIRWAAPELFGEVEDGMSQSGSRRADIYSFGSLMLQILTGKLPFHGIHRISQIVIMISRGEKPSRERSWDGKAIPDTLWQFVEACWSKPIERPSCNQIIAFLERQLARL